MRSTHVICLRTLLPKDVSASGIYLSGDVQRANERLSEGTYRACETRTPFT